LATLLFTDIVDSTGLASRLGDTTWHDLLSMHFHNAGDAIQRFGGRLVTTTGDGVLAVFDSPAGAVSCALALHEVAAPQGIIIRAGVHTGEIELAGEDVRGVAVHAAARITAAAGPGEVLASESVALLCRSTDLVFEDAGEHELKGVPDRWRLYRVAD
jgi:class 3 adenylate cyclase